MKDIENPVLVYATFPSAEAAEEAGKRLVKAHLAACVNILPGMTSIYRWEGKLERGREAVMIVKTRAGLAAAVMHDIKAHHAFDNPALLVLPVIDGSQDYCRWLLAETAPSAGGSPPSRGNDLKDGPAGA